MANEQHAITCRWQPGTFDTVRVHSAHTDGLVSARTVELHLGRPAMEGLYLRGRYELHVSTTQLAFLEAALGLTLRAAPCAAD